MAAACSAVAAEGRAVRVKERKKVPNGCRIVACIIQRRISAGDVIPCLDWLRGSWTPEKTIHFLPRQNRSISATKKNKKETSDAPSPIFSTFIIQVVGCFLPSSSKIQSERWRSGFALCNPVVTFCRTFSLSRWNLFCLSKRPHREIHHSQTNAQTPFSSLPPLCG